MARRVLDKDRYVFLQRPAIEIYNKNEIVSRERQIAILNKELSFYRISPLKLTREIPSERIRNLLLNIALIVISEEKLLNEFLSLRKLPLKKISRLVEEPVFLLQKYESYLVAYIILFYGEKYPLLTRYMEYVANTRQDQFVKESRIYTGIALRKSSGKTIVLTSQGEFLAVNNTDTSVGEVTTGEMMSTKNHLKMPLLLLLFLLIVFSGVSYALSKSISTTVIIRASGEVRMKYNELGQMVASKATNKQGQKILEDAIFDKKDLDTTIGEVIEQAYIKQYIREGDEITILVSGEPLPEDFFHSGRSHDRIVDYQLSYRINNDGNLILVEAP
jgi:hypothetical protein